MEKFPDPRTVLTKETDVEKVPAIDNVISTILAHAAVGTLKQEVEGRPETLLLSPGEVPREQILLSSGELPTAPLQLLPGEVTTDPLMLKAGEIVANPLDNYHTDIEFRSSVIMGEYFEEVIETPKKTLFGKVKEGEFKKVTIKKRLSIDQRRDQFLSLLPQIDKSENSRDAVFPYFVERLLSQADITYDDKNNKVSWFTDSGELTETGQYSIMAAIEGYIKESVDLADSSYVEVLKELSTVLGEYRKAINSSVPLEGLPREEAETLFEAELALKLMLGNHIANPSMGFEAITELSFSQRRSVSEVSAPDFDALQETARNFASYQTKIMIPTANAQEKRVFVGSVDTVGISVSDLYQHYIMAPNSDLWRRIHTAIEFKNKAEGTELTIHDYRQSVYETLRDLYLSEQELIKFGKLDPQSATLVMTGWDLSDDQREGFLDNSTIGKDGVLVTNQEAITKAMNMIRLAGIMASLMLGVAGTLALTGDQGGGHVDPSPDYWDHYREATSGHGQMEPMGHDVHHVQHSTDDGTNYENISNGRHIGAAHSVDLPREDMEEDTPSHFTDSTLFENHDGSHHQPVSHSTEGKTLKDLTKHVAGLVQDPDVVGDDGSSGSTPLRELEKLVHDKTGKKHGGEHDRPRIFTSDDGRDPMSFRADDDHHHEVAPVRLTPERIDEFRTSGGNIFELQPGETISHALVAMGVSQEEMYGKDGGSGIVKDLQTHSYSTFTHEGRTYITLVVQDDPTDEVKNVHIVTPGQEVTRDGARVIFVEVNADALSKHQPGEVLAKLEGVLESGSVTENNLKGAINSVVQVINFNETQQALFEATDPVELTTRTTIESGAARVVGDYRGVDQLLGSTTFTNQDPDSVTQEKIGAFRILPASSENSVGVDEAITITPVVPYSGPDGVIGWHYDYVMGEQGSGHRLLVSRIGLDEIPADEDKADFIEATVMDAPPPVEGRDYIRISTIAEGSTLRDIVDSHDLSLVDDEDFTPTSTYVGTIVDGNWRSFAQNVGLPDTVQPEFRDGIWTTSIFRDDGSKDLVHLRAYVTDPQGVMHPVNSDADGNLPPGTSIAIVNTNEFIKVEDAIRVVNETPVQIFKETVTKPEPEGVAPVLPDTAAVVAPETNLPDMDYNIFTVPSNPTPEQLEEVTKTAEEFLLENGFVVWSSLMLEDDGSGNRVEKKIYTVEVNYDEENKTFVTGSLHGAPHFFTLAESEIPSTSSELLELISDKANTDGFNEVIVDGTVPTTFVPPTPEVDGDGNRLPKPPVVELAATPDVTVEPDLPPPPTLDPASLPTEESTSAIDTFAELQNDSPAIAQQIGYEGVALTTPDDGKIYIWAAVDKDNKIVSGDNLPADTRVVSFEITDAERPDETHEMRAIVTAKIAEMVSAGTFPGVPAVEGTPPPAEETGVAPSPAASSTGAPATATPTATAGAQVVVPTGTSAMPTVPATATATATATSTAVSPTGTATRTPTATAPARGTGPLINPTDAPTIAEDGFPSALGNLVTPTATVAAEDDVADDSPTVPAVGAAIPTPELTPAVTNVDPVYLNVDPLAVPLELRVDGTLDPESNISVKINTSNGPVDLSISGARFLELASLMGVEVSPEDGETPEPPGYRYLPPRINVSAGQAPDGETGSYYDDVIRQRDSLATTPAHYVQDEEGNWKYVFDTIAFTGNLGEYDAEKLLTEEQAQLLVYNMFGHILSNPTEYPNLIEGLRDAGVISAADANLPEELRLGNLAAITEVLQSELVKQLSRNIHERVLWNTLADSGYIVTVAGQDTEIQDPTLALRTLHGTVVGLLGPDTANVRFTESGYPSQQLRQIFDTEPEELIRVWTDPAVLEQIEGALPEGTSIFNLLGIKETGNSPKLDVEIPEEVEQLVETTGYTFDITRGELSGIFPELEYSNSFVELDEEKYELIKIYLKNGVISTETFNYLPVSIQVDPQTGMIGMRYDNSSTADRLVPFFRTENIEGFMGSTEFDYTASTNTDPWHDPSICIPATSEGLIINQEILAQALSDDSFTINELFNAIHPNIEQLEIELQEAGQSVTYPNAAASINEWSEYIHKDNNQGYYRISTVDPDGNIHKNTFVSVYLPDAKDAEGNVFRVPFNKGPILTSGEKVLLVVQLDESEMPTDENALKTMLAEKFESEANRWLENRNALGVDNALSNVATATGTPPATATATPTATATDNATSTAIATPTATANASATAAATATVAATNNTNSFYVEPSLSSQFETTYGGYVHVEDNWAIMKEGYAIIDDPDSEDYTLVQFIVTSEDGPYINTLLVIDDFTDGGGRDTETINLDDDTDSPSSLPPSFVTYFKENIKGAKVLPEPDESIAAMRTATPPTTVPPTSTLESSSDQVPTTEPTATIETGEEFADTGVEDVPESNTSGRNMIIAASGILAAGIGVALFANRQRLASHLRRKRFPAPGVEVKEVEPKTTGVEPKAAEEVPAIDKTIKATQISVTRDNPKPLQPPKPLEKYGKIDSVRVELQETDEGLSVEERLARELVRSTQGLFLHVDTDYYLVYDPESRITTKYVPEAKRKIGGSILTGFDKTTFKARSDANANIAKLYEHPSQYLNDEKGSNVPYMQGTGALVITMGEENVIITYAGGSTYDATGGLNTTSFGLHLPKEQAEKFITAITSGQVDARELLRDYVRILTTDSEGNSLVPLNDVPTEDEVWQFSGISNPFAILDKLYVIDKRDLESTRTFEILMSDQDRPQGEVDGSLEEESLEILAQRYGEQAREILSETLDEERLVQLEAIVDEARKGGKVSVAFRNNDGDISASSDLTGSPIIKQHCEAALRRGDESKNQDAIGTYQVDGVTYGVVFDGVGSHVDTYSSIQGSDILKEIMKREGINNTDLRDIVMEVNAELKARNIEGATTMTLLRINNDVLEYASVGDSMILIVNDTEGRSDIVTRMHTYARANSLLIETLSGEGSDPISPEAIDLLILDGTVSEQLSAIGRSGIQANNRGIYVDTSAYNLNEAITRDIVDSGRIVLKKGDIVYLGSDGLLGSNLRPTEIVLAEMAGLSFEEILQLGKKKVQFAYSTPSTDRRRLRVKDDDIAIIRMSFEETDMPVEAVHAEEVVETEEHEDPFGINPILNESEITILRDTLGGVSDAFYMDTQVIKAHARKVDGRFEIVMDTYSPGTPKVEPRFAHSERFYSGHHVYSIAREVFEDQSTPERFRMVEEATYPIKSYIHSYYKPGEMRVFTYDMDETGQNTYSLMIYGEQLSDGGERGRAPGSTEIDIVFSDKNKRDDFVRELMRTEDPKRLLSGLINQTFQENDETSKILNVEDKPQGQSIYEHPIIRTSKIIFYDPESKRGKILEKSEEGWVVHYESPVAESREVKGMTLFESIEGSKQAQSAAVLGSTFNFTTLYLRSIVEDALIDNKTRENHYRFVYSPSDQYEFEYISNEAANVSDTYLDSEQARVLVNTGYITRDKNDPNNGTFEFSREGEYIKAVEEINSSPTMEVVRKMLWQDARFDPNYELPRSLSHFISKKIEDTKTGAIEESFDAIASYIATEIEEGRLRVELADVSSQYGGLKVLLPRFVEVTTSEERPIAVDTRQADKKQVENIIRSTVKYESEAYAKLPVSERLFLTFGGRLTPDMQASSLVDGDISDDVVVRLSDREFKRFQLPEHLTIEFQGESLELDNVQLRILAAYNLLRYSDEDGKWQIEDLEKRKNFVESRYAEFINTTLGSANATRLLLIGRVVDASSLQVLFDAFETQKADEIQAFAEFLLSKVVSGEYYLEKDELDIVPDKITLPIIRLKKVDGDPASRQVFSRIEEFNLTEELPLQDLTPIERIELSRKRISSELGIKLRGKFASLSTLPNIDVVVPDLEHHNAILYDLPEVVNVHYRGKMIELNREVAAKLIQSGRIKLESDRWQFEGVNESSEGMISNEEYVEVYRRDPGLNIERTLDNINFQDLPAQLKDELAKIYEEDSDDNEVRLKQIFVDAFTSNKYIVEMRKIEELPQNLELYEIVIISREPEEPEKTEETEKPEEIEKPDDEYARLVEATMAGEPLTGRASEGGGPITEEVVLDRAVISQIDPRQQIKLLLNDLVEKDADKVLFDGIRQKTGENFTFYRIPGSASDSRSVELVGLPKGLSIPYVADDGEVIYISDPIHIEALHAKGLLTFSKQTDSNGQEQLIPVFRPNAEVADQYIESINPPNGKGFAYKRIWDVSSADTNATHLVPIRFGRDIPETIFALSTKLPEELVDMIVEKAKENGNLVTKKDMFEVIDEGIQYGKYRVEKKRSDLSPDGLDLYELVVVENLDYEAQVESEPQSEEEQGGELPLAEAVTVEEAGAALEQIAEEKKEFGTSGAMAGPSEIPVINPKDLETIRNISSKWIKEVNESVANGSLRDNFIDLLKTAQLPSNEFKDVSNPQQYLRKFIERLNSLIAEPNDELSTLMKKLEKLIKWKPSRGMEYRTFYYGLIQELLSSLEEKHLEETDLSEFEF